ncbi:hypothetical protein [Bradyrhizobium arachidis]|uniref:Uncharacterized protein n=1 Tax=Bradyrhizobium arachidis TaxID=858423 RepID=A0AAE7P093_9BRAD|nr:hypothetical protein [Bradyrhizobium arachidis]QOZ73756.1 hypothetical protein WN72_36015 [Bradyrhizobium arachidis]
MKTTGERPYADPEAAARKLLELAGQVEPVQDGRIHIEKINALFLFTLKASGPEFGAGIRYAVQHGWLELHESGTYVRVLPPGEGLLRQ